MVLLRIYVAGLAVLVGAIALNVLAGMIGLATWYSLLGSAGEVGVLAAIKRLTLADGLFLLVIYPGLLGACAYGVLRVC